MSILISLTLLFAFVTVAGLSDDIISLRMSGRKIPNITMLFGNNLQILFHKYSLESLFVLSPLVLAAFSIPSQNEYLLPNNICYNLFLLFLIFPFFGGYFAYMNSNQILSRKFNTAIFSYYINIFSLIILFIVLLQRISVNDMCGLIFVQQGSINDWHIYKEPILASLTLMSLYSAGGFSPFTGFSRENFKYLFYKDKNSMLSSITFIYIYRYVLFVFFSDAYLGGAGNLYYMFLKIIFINFIFSSISMLFPKINLKENLIYNVFILTILTVYTIIAGVFR